MKVRALVALFIFSLVVSVTGYSQCTQLIWEDDFSGEALDLSKWTPEVNDDGGGNNELQYYTDRDTNITVENGVLKITALKESYLTREYTSGRIVTKNKGDWRYGRVEASIKLPEGQGMWPAFWMLPTEEVYGGWPNSGEIDIMELVGGGSGDSTIYGTLHSGPPRQYTNGSYKLTDAKFSGDFHLFAIEWSPDTIKWYVDDIMYSYKTAADITPWVPFQEKFHVILNLAVGGNWPGSPDATTVFPQVMEVDYVRVYGDVSDQEITAIDSAYALGALSRYTFPAIPDGTFSWNVTKDAYILSGADSNVFSVRWGCDTATISLNVVYPDCGSVDYHLPVTFSVPAIAGEDAVFQKTPDVEFSVPALDSTVFNWSVPDGVLINGETDTNTIDVDWGCVAGRVKVIANNRCGTIEDSISVELLTPMLSGPSKVTANTEGVDYSITSMPEATYIWSIPEGASIASGQNTSNIVVNFGETPGRIKVVYSNTCGTDSISVLVAITDTIVICDYETSILEFQGWEDDVEPEWLENPQKDDVNNTDHAGISWKAGSPWSGAYGDLGYNLDMSMHNRFSILIKGPKAGNVLFKIEDVGENIPPEVEDPTETPPVEVSMPYSDAGNWEELVYDFTGTTSKAFDRITVFYDFGSEDSNTFYFDEIKLLPSDTIIAQQSNVDDIIEGNEDNKKILVTLVYDKFVAGINVDNWHFANLPEGVTVGSVDRIANDSAIVVLSGNSTEDITEDITDFTTTISSAELVKSNEDIVLTEGVLIQAGTTSTRALTGSAEFFIIPNPASGLCLLKSDKEIVLIEVYDFKGSQVFKQPGNGTTQTSLDVSEMEAGIYIVKARLSSHSITIKKLIVK